MREIKHDIKQISPTWWILRSENVAFFGHSKKDVSLRHWLYQEHKNDIPDRIAEKMIEDGGIYAPRLSSDCDQVKDPDPGGSLLEDLGAMFSRLISAGRILVPFVVLLVLGLVSSTHAKADGLAWEGPIEYYHGPGCPEELYALYDEIALELSAWLIEFKYMGKTESLGKDGLTSISCSHNAEETLRGSSVPYVELEARFGLTRRTRRDGRIVEADTWLDLRKLDHPNTSWRTKLIHEIGHVLGMGHSEGESASAMNSKPRVERFSIIDRFRLQRKYLWGGSGRGRIGPGRIPPTRL